MYVCVHVCVCVCMCVYVCVCVCVYRQQEKRKGLVPTWKEAAQLPRVW